MRKYGYFSEVLVSIIEIISFTCLLAGNLVGTSLIINFCFNLPVWAGIIIAGGACRPQWRFERHPSCCGCYAFFDCVLFSEKAAAILEVDAPPQHIAILHTA